MKFIDEVLEREQRIVQMKQEIGIPENEKVLTYIDLLRRIEYKLFKNKHKDKLDKIDFLEYFDNKYDDHDKEFLLEAIDFFMMSGEECEILETLDEYAKKWKNNLVPVK